MTEEQPGTHLGRARMTCSLPSCTLQFWPLSSGPCLSLPGYRHPPQVIDTKTGTLSTVHDDLQQLKGKTCKVQLCWENLRAGFNTESALIPLVQLHLQEPQGQMSIFEKNLEAVQNWQWVAFLSVWGTRWSSNWEECISQMQGLLTTCLWLEPWACHWAVVFFIFSHVKLPLHH